jgi:Cullin family
VDSLLHHTSRQKVVDGLCASVLDKHSAPIFDDLVPWLMDGHLELIMKVQKLFSYSSWSVDTFSKRYCEALKLCLNRKLDQQKPAEFVPQLLDWYKGMLGSGQTGQDAASLRFLANNEASFKAYITESSAEKVCVKWADARIKTIVNMSETEMADFLEDLELVLKLTLEKSLFELHYKQYLRRRLMGPMTQDGFLYEMKVLEKLKVYLDYEQVEYMELGILEVKNSGALQGRRR